MSRHLAVSPFALVAALSLVSLVTSPEAEAQVNVTVRSTPEAVAFANRAGITVADLESQLRGEVERLFQTYRLKDYLQSYSDAHAFTTRGLGVDYATDLRFFEIGAAANVALNSEDAFNAGDLRSRSAVAGVSTNFTLMAGLNLGFMGARPVTIFGNFFKGNASFDEYDADLENRGLHAQIKLLAPTDESTLDLLVRWGGIAITSGVEYAKTRLTLGQVLRREVPLGNVPRSVATVDVASMGAFNVTTSTWSIPLEVTTSLRLLSLATAYGGVGFDWQMGGSSDMNVALDGTLVGKVTADGSRVPLGDATVTATESAEPSAGRIRGLVGVQFNVFFVRLFVQTNFVPNPATASVAFGARVAY